MERGSNNVSVRPALQPRLLVVLRVLGAIGVLGCTRLNESPVTDEPDSSVDGTRPGAVGSPGGISGPPGVGVTGGSTSLDAPCAVGETRCAPTGATIQLCTLGAGWIDKEPCFSGACADGACTGACHPGDKQCGSDQTPEVCNADGQWVRSQPCPAICTGQGVCTGVCKPGTKACSGPDGLAPKICDENGSWAAAGEPCKNLCSSGSCSGSCMPGARRCSGKMPETCSSMGTWEPSTPCPAVCSAAGLCVECSAGDKRCRGLDVVQQCGSDGKWVDGITCPSVCTGGGVCAGDCKPGSPDSCMGDRRLQCQSDGSLQTSSCDRGCAGGSCCGGSTEALGGKCASCGGEGQSCCKIAQPACQGNLVCGNDGVCHPPCGGSGQPCCDGTTTECHNNCKTTGTQRCVNGNWDRSKCPADQRCCNDSDCGACQLCSGGACKARSCAMGCDSKADKCIECRSGDIKCTNATTLSTCVGGFWSNTKCTGHCFNDLQFSGKPGCGCKPVKCTCDSGGFQLGTACDSENGVDVQFDCNSMNAVCAGSKCSNGFIPGGCQ
jgi:hypothetical protein